MDELKASANGSKNDGDGPMRELTDFELDLVSGGTDGGEIVVIGYPPYYGYPTHYTPTPSPSSPGSGAPPGATSVSNGFNQTMDLAVDAVTIDIANKIKAMPDHDRWEYGAWIYKDSLGNIRQSEILRGPEWGISPLGRSLQDFKIPDGSTLLGQIHNHPTYNPGNQELTGRSYADNYDLNAIAGAAGYAQPDHRISVDQTNFRGYIMHDNVVDEYDRVTHYTTYDTSHGIQEIRGVSKDSTTAI